MSHPRCSAKILCHCTRPSPSKLNSWLSHAILAYLAARYHDTWLDPRNHGAQKPESRAISRRLRDCCCHCPPTIRPALTTSHSTCPPIHLPTWTAPPAVNLGVCFLHLNFPRSGHGLLTSDPTVVSSPLTWAQCLLISLPATRPPPNSNPSCLLLATTQTTPTLPTTKRTLRMAAIVFHAGYAASRLPLLLSLARTRAIPSVPLPTRRHTALLVRIQDPMAPIASIH